MASREEDVPLIIKIVSKRDKLPGIVPAKQTRPGVLNQKVRGPCDSEQKQKKAEIKDAFPIKKKRSLGFQPNAEAGLAFLIAS